MIAVIQRCSRGKVTVSEKVVGKIEQGLVILLGVQIDDTENDVNYLVNKISGLRIFRDENDKMNLSIKDINGSVLVISQFTLCGNTKKGRRPSFINAAPPEDGNRLYEYFMTEIEKESVPVESGEFGADMKVELVNDGPVTFVLNSKD
ncbi:MAG: D-tyrosyl-tRNA(Tyr) deacylase [Candidatus Marinimicrobia bacterium]|jgi:D-tyrosyl-tRNA(Tyr) deacylase|nr:D-tyrosyl-tRNA(Tyr) deacylase [Candidatus Neomarinimicrobiota bacterium]MBT3838422.1 D-tyrosyl-tRNA(Tyr) deacylase [Candidatus Neomarinimicrobiota bacterium]MBT3998727.1 D-tyrosyl-tRNA(Tyr) deacylase [Candidatus Neomarinimicrobiota bacterium]MBT4283306.1 D-tyrosyl-tRNA(Tyr) deacylase [Candidatus Neomarinimicrobiota bacterium]MBT4578381.1 D-tyrosyl-tRNA(Tyr) deacylase [Candidatus Neomarinimicrobiota bacterium]